MAKETRIFRYEPDDLRVDDLQDGWIEEFVEGLADEELPEDATIQGVEITAEVEDPDHV